MHNQPSIPARHPHRHTGRAREIRNFQFTTWEGGGNIAPALTAARRLLQRRHRVRALSHQRPLLIIPHGRDQDWNAIRVTERGAGLKLPTTAVVGEIAAPFKRLLEDPAFTLAAIKLGSLLAADAHADEVTPLLGELASRPEPAALPDGAGLAATAESCSIR